MCTALILAASETDPPEYCSEPAEPGEECCDGHLMEPDPDEAYDRAREEDLWER